MIRAIRFRGRTLNGKWVYGDLLHYTNPFESNEANNGSIIVTDYKSKSDNSFKIVIPESVGQFTGLFDKNEKEIYEGDIVRTYVAIKDYEEGIAQQFWRVGVIRFTRGQFALTECKNYADKEMKTPHYWSPNKRALCTYPAYRSEIIGNFFDNPEILKKDTL